MHVLKGSLVFRLFKIAKLIIHQDRVSACKILESIRVRAAVGGSTGSVPGGRLFVCRSANASLRHPGALPL